MQIVAICEKMGWDYYTYQAQPRWFLKLLRYKYKIDAEEQNKQNKRGGMK